MPFHPAQSSRRPWCDCDVCSHHQHDRLPLASSEVLQGFPYQCGISAPTCVAHRVLDSYIHSHLHSQRSFLWRNRARRVVLPHSWWSLHGYYDLSTDLWTLGCSRHWSRRDAVPEVQLRVMVLTMLPPIQSAAQRADGSDWFHHDALLGCQNGMMRNHDRGAWRPGPSETQQRDGE